MIKIIVLLFSFNVVHASVIQGGIISAKQVQGDTFNIGDIQESVLTEAQFLSRTGSCWRMLKTGANVVGTDLGSKVGVLSDFSGRFLRDFGNLSAGVGMNQQDEIKEHTHWVSSGVRDDANGSTGGTNSQMPGLVSDAGSYSASDPMSTIGRYSGNSDNHGETRPKSFIINMFIKVNNDCN